MKIINNHPECEQHLRTIAEEIREAKTEKIVLPEGISRYKVSPAVELDILAFDAEGVSFSEPISFLYFLKRNTRSALQFQT